MNNDIFHFSGDNPSNPGKPGQIFSDAIKIRPLYKEETIPYDLLLLADPDRNAINKYIGLSDLHVAILNNRIIGVYALYPLDKTLTEIKNIAVDDSYQNKGVGKLLLAHACQTAITMGYRNITIGTGNSSILQLYLYQKQGFEISHIKNDFFVTNYPEPIFENEIQCRHMIMLVKQL